MTMMSRLKLVLIFSVRLVVASSLEPRSNTCPSIQPKPGFDYFVLALQWPAAFCHINRQSCDPNPPLPQHRQCFTIHGLWPQSSNGKSPRYCSAWYMTNNDLKLFRNDLLNYWPSLLSAGNFDRSKGFWLGQWRKHGSCSSNVFTPQQYLQKTIDLARRYGTRIYDELRRLEIRSDGVTAHQVQYTRRVVKDITGYYPMLNIQLNYAGDHLLLEIHLCVRKDGVTLFDCDPHYIFASP